MAAIGIIPARYDSTRFPGKPLADIAGFPMIRHVYERACRCTQLQEVLVATDDQRIFDAVTAFGGDAIMTNPYHPTGTDRIAEVAERLTGASIVVNIQGDEPLIAPEAIDAVVQALEKDPAAPMSSVMTPLPNPAQARDINIVKVVTDLNGYALFFSRSPIPYIRDQFAGTGPWKRHIGLYAYRREFLVTFAHLPVTPLERLEKLEQLRALEHGYRIKMVERSVDHSIGVDTPEDLQRVRALIEQRMAAGG